MIKFLIDYFLITELYYYLVLSNKKWNSLHFAAFWGRSEIISLILDQEPFLINDKNGVYICLFL